MGRSLLTARRALIVAAHPDDEVLGAGIWLSRHSGGAVHILHITDGSPRDMQNARALGFRGRKPYAAARRRELLRALRIVSVPAKNCTGFAYVDREAYLNLTRLTRQMEGLIGRLQPDLVLSPAYEGGHPDHDAAAFAVALVRKSIKSFRHWEYPLYHANRKGRMITGKFIARPDDGRETVISLSEDEKSLKSRMLACFETQQEIINRFRVKSERFRPAPAYDFTRPPHPGPLQYERWGWGITGAEWRRRAREALAR